MTVPQSKRKMVDTTNTQIHKYINLIDQKKNHISASSKPTTSLHIDKYLILIKYSILFFSYICFVLTSERN